MQQAATSDNTHPSHTEVPKYLPYISVPVQRKITVVNTNCLLSRSYLLQVYTNRLLFSRTDRHSSYSRCHTCYGCLSHGSCYRGPWVYPGMGLITDCQLLSLWFTKTANEHYSVLTSHTNHTHFYNSPATQITQIYTTHVSLSMLITQLYK